MSQTYIAPSPEHINHLRGMDLTGPVVMVNLLRFKPDGGREAYAKGGDDAWDEIILVEYPSVQAFFEMTGHLDYPGDIRADALIDSRLYCTQAQSRG